MCILCAVQKWARQVATMLPWLVIPFIGLWALSQFFPPGFRFEMTSPQLACVLVLLVTLFWYQVLMPRLSAWRARRSARLREIKRIEAIELEKLKRTAIRRCRNCKNPYRDQNPGGGKFTCLSCGHVSKRPVLDMPEPVGLGISSFGVVGDLVDRSGKMWNGKVWSENEWNCEQYWLEKGNLLSRFLMRKSNYYGKNGGGAFCSEGHCLTEESYSGILAFTCRVFEAVFIFIRWLWRKIVGVTSRNDDTLSDEEGREIFNKGASGVNFHESKAEKARRKAEEKRQARLEKELLEEEERKQREEVAKLVEEQRKLRDEKLEAEREHFKGPAAIDRENDKKREAERKRQERRKEKERGSSKSNSDCEELEKRESKKSEKKLELDRIEIERDVQKAKKERVRTQGSDTMHHSNIGTVQESSKGGSGRYLDRMKGSFLPSSKAFKGASFFGRGPRSSARVAPEASKPVGSLEHIQASPSAREVPFEVKPQTVPKKPWSQLFNLSPVVSTLSNDNVTRRPDRRVQAEAQSLQVPVQSSPMLLSDQISYGLPLSFSPPYPDRFQNVVSISPSAAEPIFPHIGESPHNFILEDQEIFDPSYVTDPMSLLGPVSESLDHFPSYVGSGVLKDTVLERPNAPRNVHASAEVNKPSPIEAPNSRSRITEERHSNDRLFPSYAKNQNMNSSPLYDSSVSQEQGTWQMWDTTRSQDVLSLVGSSASWLSPIEQNKQNQEGVSQHSPNYAMESEFAEANQLHLSTASPNKNGRNGGTPICSGLEDNRSCLQKSLPQPLSGDGDDHSLLIPQKDIFQNEATDGSSGASAAGNRFDLSPSSYWSNEDSAVKGSEGVKNSVLARPPVGGLFSSPDVQSVWSFK